MTIHSEKLSTRNSFGITPKGPMGPLCPLGSLGSPLALSPWVPLAPWVPLVPWVPLGPFGPLRPLALGSLWPLGPGWWGGVSAPCRGYKRASRGSTDGAKIDGDNIRVGGYARSVLESSQNDSKIIPKSSQNHPNMTQKSSQHDPRMIPT